MLKLVVPIVFAMIGVGGGVGAGLLLRPPGPQELAASCQELGLTGDRAEAPAGHSVGAARAEHDTEGEIDGEPTHDYVKLNNQFVVPIVENGEVSALVVLSVSIEVALGTSEGVYSREPKLRDAFLQVLFDHANAGGFSGAFTNANNMDVLRHALLEVASGELGEVVSDILITDIVRQES